MIIVNLFGSLALQLFIIITVKQKMYCHLLIKQTMQNKKNARWQGKIVLFILTIKHVVYAVFAFVSRKSIQANLEDYSMTIIILHCGKYFDMNILSNIKNGYASLLVTFSRLNYTTDHEILQTRC